MTGLTNLANFSTPDRPVPAATTLHYRYDLPSYHLAPNYPHPEPRLSTRDPAEQPFAVTTLLDPAEEPAPRQSSPEPSFRYYEPASPHLVHQPRLLPRILPFTNSLTSYLLTTIPSLLLSSPIPAPTIQNFARTSPLTYSDLANLIQAYTSPYLTWTRTLASSSFTNFNTLTTSPLSIPEKWVATKAILRTVREARTEVKKLLRGFEEVLDTIDGQVLEWEREVEEGFKALETDVADVVRVAELKGLRASVDSFIAVLWEGRKVLRKARKGVGKTGRAMWGFVDGLEVERLRVGDGVRRG
ncbi:hypothetical protein BJ508DRAFT_418287 [Ascobolus immersus RN42]|uniref:Uncharacterized protein n=1 Tax=Ascobolus immersus RN42 TaxID=1160509 RepID=A0A3N4HMR2_ASCIM|nr:hypothetical protein BJ508DRAFT_418287 [Ascobolus immersus RN42]